MVLLNKLQLDDVILEALSKRVKESAIFRGDIFEILSQSFESPDRFLDNYKEGIIKKELLSCIIEITGRRNKKKLKYNASVNLDLEKVVRDINLATSTTFMVSVVPSIITKKVLDCKIKERGVIAPSALSISSEIIEDCKRLGLNLVESSCWT